MNMPRLKHNKATFTIKFTVDELIEIRDDMRWAWEQTLPQQRTEYASLTAGKIINFLDDLNLQLLGDRK
jgi:hypothetical protein